jgi:hypothetical protein
MRCLKRYIAREIFHVLQLPRTTAKSLPQYRSICYQGATSPLRRLASLYEKGFRRHIRGRVDRRIVRSDLGAPGIRSASGCPMSNTTTWSIIGPITVLIGIVIAVFSWRKLSSK